MSGSVEVLLVVVLPAGHVAVELYVKVIVPEPSLPIEIVYGPPPDCVHPLDEIVPVICPDNSSLGVKFIGQLPVIELTVKTKG